MCNWRDTTSVPTATIKYQTWQQNQESNDTWTVPEFPVWNEQKEKVEEKPWMVEVAETLVLEKSKSAIVIQIKLWGY